MSLEECYLYAGGLLALVIIYSLLHPLYFFAVMIQGMKVRVALSAIIYRKVNKLKQGKCELIF